MTPEKNGFVDIFCLHVAKYLRVGMSSRCKHGKVSVYKYCTVYYIQKCAFVFVCNKVSESKNDLHMQKYSFICTQYRAAKRVALAKALLFLSVEK